MPVCYGGGINTIEDAKHIFGLGIEKIALNNAAIENPQLITEIANIYGSQAVVVSMDYKKAFLGNNTVYAINGQNKTKFDVIDFVNNRHKDMPSKYKVFKELFVICWAGVANKSRDKTFLSRVDIELINEQIKLFYSAQDVVTITFDEDSFTIIEYVPLGLNDKTSFYPLEKQTLHFHDNGYYKIDREMLFQPPEFNRKMLFHIYNSNISLLKKLHKGLSLTEREHKDLENLPSTFMVCYLNGFEDAKQKLIDAKLLLKPFTLVYLSFKEALRILRKMKYDVQ